MFMNINKAVIGMIHVDPLPGTPRYRGSFKDIVSRASWEAAVYAEQGVDMIMVENMHDTPYLKRHVGPEITAAMTAICSTVKADSGLPCGVQILAGANKAALAVAQAAGLDFIRVEGFAFAHVADEGILESDAGELLRYRRMIGAEQIRVIADIKKKHAAHSITADVPVAETAKAAAFMHADGLIVTGAATGAQADPNDAAEARNAVKLPVLIGSGITRENLAEYMPHADGFIVGSHFKQDGDWRQAVDPKRVQRFMAAARKLREG